MKKLILSILVFSLMLSGSAFALSNSVTGIKNLALVDTKTYANNIVSVNTAQALDVKYSTYIFTNNGYFNNGSVTTPNYIWPAPVYTLATTDVKEGAIKVFSKTTAAATANVVITPASANGFSFITLIEKGDTCTLIKRGTAWERLARNEARVTAAATATAVATYNVTIELKDANGKVYLVPAVAK